VKSTASVGNRPRKGESYEEEERIKHSRNRGKKKKKPASGKPLNQKWLKKEDKGVPGQEGWGDAKEPGRVSLAGEEIVSRPGGKI